MMKNFVKGMVLAVLGVSFFSGCARIDTSLPDESSLQASDKAIAREVYYRLGNDNPEGSLASVGVQCQDGIVTLYGVMPSLQAKNKALTVARGTPGIKGVIDKLTY